MILIQDHDIIEEDPLIEARESEQGQNNSNSSLGQEAHTVIIEEVVIETANPPSPRKGEQNSKLKTDNSQYLFCTLCNIGFSRQDTYTSHLRRHTNEMTFFCS